MISISFYRDCQHGDDMPLSHVAFRCILRLGESGAARVLHGLREIVSPALHSARRSATLLRLHRSLTARTCFTLCVVTLTLAPDVCGSIRAEGLSATRVSTTEEPSKKVQAAIIGRLRTYLKHGLADEARAALDKMVAEESVTSSTSWSHGRLM